MYCLPQKRPQKLGNVFFMEEATESFVLFWMDVIEFGLKFLHLLVDDIRPLIDMGLIPEYFKRSCIQYITSSVSSVNTVFD